MNLVCLRIFKPYDDENLDFYYDETKGDNDKRRKRPFRVGDFEQSIVIVYIFTALLLLVQTSFNNGWEELAANLIYVPLGVGMALYLGILVYYYVGKNRRKKELESYKMENSKEAEINRSFSTHAIN